MQNDRFVPNCCKYKANDTRKESNKKKLEAKQIPKTILHPKTSHNDVPLVKETTPQPQN
jgi:hypothetical protein